MHNIYLYTLNILIYTHIYRRHQHYKQRKHSLQENSNWRRQSNTEGGNTGVRRISVQPEDATLEVGFNLFIVIIQMLLNKDNTAFFFSC